MSSDAERNLRILAGIIDPDAPEPDPSQYSSAEAAGTLSAETIRQALDELWNYRVPLPPPGYLGSRKPFGLVPVNVQPPEWTVEADGWRLVIENGAIAGLISVVSR